MPETKARQTPSMGEAEQKEQMVTFQFEIADQTINMETRADVFLEGVRVQRRAGVQIVHFGPRARIVIPPAAHKQMLLDLLGTTDYETAHEVLVAMEERMR